MRNQGITILKTLKMCQSYIERLSMVKSSYPVARKPHLYPSFVAGFEKDPMIGLAKALSSWFVVR